MPCWSAWTNEIFKVFWLGLLDHLLICDQFEPPSVDLKRFIPPT